MSGKRSRDALAEEDERPTISIQLAGGEAIHGVDLQLLSLLSSCARGLPADAVCWDLRQLLVEGQPVQRPTVLAYINSAYQHAYGEPFREPQQQEQEQAAAQPPKKRKQRKGQQQGEPEQQQQQEEQQALPQAAADVSTFAGMARLLLFADAVGSTPPLLRACAAGVDKLSLRVQLPTGLSVDLSIRVPYYWSPDNDQLARVTEQQSGVIVATFSKATLPTAKAALLQQVQEQTEVLLYAAYKLQLSDVAEAVQSFIRMQSAFAVSVLWGAMRRVLSPRVLDAAAGYRSLHETLLLNHLVTKPCSFKTGPVPNTLVPIDLPAEQRQPLKFTAEVVQDAFGSSKGVQLPVEVNLLGNSMKVGLHTHDAQILLGCMAFTEERKQTVLGPPAPATD